MSSMFWPDANSPAAPMSDLQRKLCDRFVAEYLHDYDIKRAALRCGFGLAWADQYGTQLWNDSYVQQRLKEVELGSVDENQKEQDKKDEQRVRMLLRRMAEYPYPASQVAAVTRMAAVLGMNAPIKTEQNVNHRGGVMEVPPVANPEQWEVDATASQGALVNDTNADT